MQNFDKSVPFDPGYSAIAFAFMNEIDYLTQKFCSVRNPNQKRFELARIEKTLVDIINKSSAFYLGCMLWGGFLHSRFKDSPKPIEGNHADDMTEEEKQNADCAFEVKSLLDFIKTFDRDCKYFLKHPAKIEAKTIEILESYIEFAQINNNFIETKLTSDVMIPKNLAHFDSLSAQDLDRLCEKIYNIIDSKDIEKLLEIGYFD